MKRHLGVVIIMAGVFVFFMAQAPLPQCFGGRAHASDTAALTTMISTRCINLMDTVSRMPTYIRLFLDLPALAWNIGRPGPAIDFRLQDIGYRDIENIKQIERSV